MLHLDFVSLGNYCVIESGFAFKSEKFTNEPDDICLVKGSNLGHLSIDWVNGPKWPTSDYEKLKRYELIPDDIVIAMDRPIVGGNLKYAWIQKKDPKALLVQRVARLRGKNGLDQKYLKCVVADPSFQSYIDTITTGVNVPHISGPDMRRYKFPLPPLPTQQKIAHILSAYDDLIENNLKRIKLLEEMAQMTYEEWFVRMKFPGHKQAVIDSETGLPEGWTVDSLSTICLINKDSISKKTAPNHIHYIDIASVNTGGYEKPQKFVFTEAPSRARRRVKYGDTIFSTVRPNRKTYSLILENDPILIASTGFAVLTPKIQDTYPFIYQSVANQHFVDKTVAVAGGAAYPAINQSDFEQIKVTIPIDEVVLKFSELMIPNFRSIGNLNKQNQRLKEARDILLPRLMTGMIDVNTLDLPEPLESKKEVAS